MAGKQGPLPRCVAVSPLGYLGSHCMAAGVQEQAFQAVKAEVPFSPGPASEVTCCHFLYLLWVKTSIWATQEMDHCRGACEMDNIVETGSTIASFPWRAWAPPQAYSVGIWRNRGALREVPCVRSSTHIHTEVLSLAFWRDHAPSFEPYW